MGTDRKKDKAPAKKVDEIMKLINTKTDEKEPEAPAPADGKKQKKAKKQKPRDFINKDQFIDACSNDEALKKLFVDSIFAAASAEPSELEACVNAQASTSLSADLKSDNVNVDLNSFALDAPAFEVTTSSKVECVEFTSIDTPAVEVEAPAVELKAEAPSVSAEVPDIAANVETIVESVSESVAEAVPDVNVSVEAPTVEVSTTEPVVETGDEIVATTTET